MKPTVLLLYILFTGVMARAQQDTTYWYFDQQLRSIAPQHAFIKGKEYKDGANFLMEYWSLKTGNKVAAAHFKDSLLNILNGTYRLYYPNSLMVQEEGNYNNDHKQGLWQQWDERGLKSDSSWYDNDIQQWSTRFNYYDNGVLWYYQVKDSLRDTTFKQAFNKNGILIYEESFKGQNGVLKHFDSSGVHTEMVATREEKEAEFPGGAKAWAFFLKRNLNQDVVVDNHAPPGLYIVMVTFRIDKNGNVVDVVADNAPGFGTEEEAVRVIKKSPQWKPARQFGRYVNAYRRQPISFAVIASGKTEVEVQ